MRTHTLWSVIRILITFLILFGIWLLFTFRLKTYSVIAGLAGSFAIALITYRVFIPAHEASRHSFLPRPLFFLIFFMVLIFQLYASSFKMLKTMLRKDASPRIVHFRTRLRSDLARMILSNSITITPGTITLDLNDDHLTVHWYFCNTIHSKLAGETVKGQIENHIRRVWV